MSMIGRDKSLSTSALSLRLMIETGDVMGTSGQRPQANFQDKRSRPRAGRGRREALAVTVSAAANVFSGGQQPSAATASASPAPAPRRRRIARPQRTLPAAPRPEARSPRRIAAARPDQESGLDGDETSATDAVRRKAPCHSSLVAKRRGIENVAWGIAGLRKW